MIVQIKRLDKEARIPRYMTTGSSGVDLQAMMPQDSLTVSPSETVLIPTGIAISFHDNVTGLILPRSGLGHRNGIILGNGTGVMDSDYRDEYMVSLWNRGDEPYLICREDRIAQLLFVPILKVEFEEVEELDPSTRIGGFGHTGK